MTDDPKEHDYVQFLCDEGKPPKFVCPICETDDDGRYCLCNCHPEEDV